MPFLKVQAVKQPVRDWGDEEADGLEIDRLVCSLYGLTFEEITIMEDATKED